MTLLLNISDDEPSSIVKLTTCAAVAVSKALKEVTNISVGIKWVNDIYLDEKKVSGILAEAFFANGRRYAAIGVGVNLSTADFPESIAHIAGSLGIKSTKETRDRLVCELAASIFDGYERVKNGDTSYLSEYRSLSIVLGRRVTYIVNGEHFDGVAEDICEDGGLRVIRDDGSMAVLSSGEISLSIKKEDER
jgi:BirA family biotin operon repressor/biotin-[acetyl-CoA-carboxylase] ligase